MTDWGKERLLWAVIAGLNYKGLDVCISSEADTKLTLTVFNKVLKFLDANHKKLWDKPK